MKINIYSFEDNFLGTVAYLGQNKWEDDGFDSEDFDKVTLDKIVEFLQSKHNERLTELLIGKIDWFTVNLPEGF